MQDIIIINLKEIGVSTINSAQGRDYSRAIVYAILNFGFHKLWSYLVKYLFSYLR